MKNNEEYVRKNEMQKFNLENQLKIAGEENKKHSQTIKLLESKHK